MTRRAVRREARAIAALVAVFVTAGISCSIDKVLEGNVVTDARLLVNVGATSLAFNQGDAASVDASITRLGDFTGEVTFAIGDLPPTITAEIGTPVTSGAITSTRITFRALDNAPVGTARVFIRGNAKPSGFATTPLDLVIAARPAVSVNPTVQSVTVIRNGIRPLPLVLSRTNYTGPVTLSLVGVAGITATFGTNPVAATGADATIRVAPEVAPGTYQVKVRASAAGLADADTPLSVVVSPDALQVVAPDAATAQASVLTTDLIINRLGGGGAVTLTADVLPPAATASFPNGPATGGTATLRIAVGAATPAGVHFVTLRASDGVNQVSTVFVLTVAASNVAMTLVPQSVTLLQGTSAVSTLTLVRTSYTGPVSVELPAIPAGITVVPADASIIGTTTTLLVTTARDLAPGSYAVPVRGVPASSGSGAPALDPLTASLTVTVVATPTGNGNVLLDWSRCAAPTWVAAQDGTGPWIPLTGTGGRFIASVQSGRGGFAWSEGGTQVSVRFGLQSELSATPIDLCPPPDPGAGKTVSGIAQHGGLTEVWQWRLGGGIGASTLSTANFVMTGVQEGTYDLIGWGNTQTLGIRGFIARDLNIPAGGSVGTVNLIGDGSFAATQTNWAFSGFVNESITETTSYLTTDACIASDLSVTQFAVFTGSATVTMRGVPAQAQRPTDFHLVDVAARAANGTRTVSLTSKSISVSRTVALPPPIAPTVQSPAGSHKRLFVSLGVIPAQYNSSMTVRYSDGSRAMSMTASVAYVGSGAFLTMPELGGVTGFPASAAIPPTATGTYTIILDGSSNQPRCVDQSTRWTVTRSGSF